MPPRRPYLLRSARQHRLPPNLRPIRPGKDLQFLEFLGEDVLLGAPALFVVSVPRARRNQAADNDISPSAPADCRCIPRTAASVSTRVVSWKEAAEMNDSVARDAFVLCPAGRERRCAGVSILRFETFRWCRARGPDPPVPRAGTGYPPGTAISDLAQHLPHDDLDMLVVDLHALQPVDLLNLVDQVVRQLGHALQSQDVVGIGFTVGDDLAAA